VIPFEWLEQARVRIDAHIRRTPLTFDSGRGLHIKWENRQVTGSFKARGAFNKVLSLEDWERAAGLVTVSAGNHGQGVALAAQMSRANVEVFVPEHAVPRKVDAMRELGAQVHVVQGGYAEAEAAGRAYASEQEKTWISPYNDGQVIAGQGTVALEIMESLPLLFPSRLEVKGERKVESGREQEPPMVWVVPVGGGGLISGFGAALKAVAPRSRLIGVQSEASAFAHGLFRRGSQAGIRELPSLADGLSGAVEADSVTIPLMRELADDVLLVSEAEIAQAIAFAWYEYGQVIEGSSAVTLAALFSGKMDERPAVTVITGGNIQPEVHAGILEQYAEGSWV
jgi:threonine dehydratase